MMSEQLMIVPAEWFPEHEVKETEYVEEQTEIFRIVDEDGKLQKSYVGEKYNKPYYTSRKGARVALHHFPEGSRIQKGEVTWRDEE